MHQPWGKVTWQPFYLLHRRAGTSFPTGQRDWKRRATRLEATVGSGKQSKINIIKNRQQRAVIRVYVMMRAVLKRRRRQTSPQKQSGRKRLH